MFMNDLDFHRKEGNQIIAEVLSDVALRLTSLGLLFEVPEFSVNQENGNLYYETKANKNEKIFSRTMFGTKYIEIIDQIRITFGLLQKKARRNDF